MGERERKRRKLNGVNSNSNGFGGFRGRKRQNNNVILDEEAFLQRAMRKNKKAKLMGDDKLGAVFDWMPAIYRSKRNVEKDIRDEEKEGDSGLDWLKGSDYALIDFKERLEDRLSM